MPKYSGQVEYKGKLYPAKFEYYDGKMKGFSLPTAPKEVKAAIKGSKLGRVKNVPTGKDAGNTRVEAVLIPGKSMAKKAPKKSKTMADMVAAGEGKKPKAMLPRLISPLKFFGQIMSEAYGFNDSEKSEKSEYKDDRDYPRRKPMAQ